MKICNKMQSKLGFKFYTSDLGFNKLEMCECRSIAYVLILFCCEILKKIGSLLCHNILLFFLQFFVQFILRIDYHFYTIVHQYSMGLGQ